MNYKNIYQAPLLSNSVDTYRLVHTGQTVKRAYDMNSVGNLICVEFTQFDDSIYLHNSPFGTVYVKYKKPK